MELMDFVQVMMSGIISGLTFAVVMGPALRRLHSRLCEEITASNERADIALHRTDRIMTMLLKDRYGSN